MDITVIYNLPIWNCIRNSYTAKSLHQQVWLSYPKISLQLFTSPQNHNPTNAKMLETTQRVSSKLVSGVKLTSRDVTISEFKVYTREVDHFTAYSFDTSSLTIHSDCSTFNFFLQFFPFWSLLHIKHIPGLSMGISNTTLLALKKRKNLWWRHRDALRC